MRHKIIHNDSKFINWMKFMPGRMEECDFGIVIQEALLIN